MPLLPRVFISAVSSELRGARDLVAKTLQALGYEPVWQDIFPTESGTVYDMLERKIADCQAVVHLVGRRYGFESRVPHPKFGRVSYTQFEALQARATGKKLFIIFCDEWTVPDGLSAEDPELVELQRHYRESLQSDPLLHHLARNPIELELLVYRLRDELARLRRRLLYWAVVVLALLAVLAGAVVFLLHGQQQQTALLKRALAQLAEVEARQKQAGGNISPDEARAQAYAFLEKELHLPSGTLAQKLPVLARELYQNDAASPLQRARAAYTLRNYVTAEQLGLAVANQDRQVFNAGGKTDENLRGETVSAFELAGQAALQRQAYADALAHLRAAEPFLDQAKDPLEWSRLQWNVAVVLLESGGDFREAETALRVALNGYHQSRGDDDPDALVLHGNLGIALYNEGRYPEAAAEFRRALETAQRVLGTRDRTTLRSGEHLAVALYAQGGYVEAERQLRAVVDDEERALGAEDPDTISGRHNLGMVLDALGRHAEALTQHRAALAVRERLLGPKDPNTLATRHNLAFTLDASGQYPEAEKVYRSLLADEEDVLPRDHPELLSARSDLANMLGHAGQTADVEERFRAVLAAFERKLGPDHPSTLASRNDFADTLQHMGRYAEAEAEHRTVLATRQRVLGREHPDTLLTSYGLAVDLKAQGRTDEARTLVRDARDVAERTLPADNPDRQRYEKLWSELGGTAKHK